MKIFSCGQIREIDAYTIQNEPVSSIDLMERAASKIFSWIVSKFSRSENFIVFAGPGNNGGDGLAVARMLTNSNYTVKVFQVQTGSSLSRDCEINLERLKESGVDIYSITKRSEIPVIHSETIIIDAIFGSGLNRPVEGLAGDVIKLVNESGALVISVDLPSGLFCEDNSGNSSDTIINARYSLTFQFPRLSFMFADNDMYIGEWHLLDIGLHQAAIINTQSDHKYISISDACAILRDRKKFDHKGVYGHCLIVAGSYGKMGAAVLSAGAALRSGSGLVSCYIPRCGYQVLQGTVPEAMVMTDSSDMVITDIPSTEKFSATGIGPGIGTQPETAVAFRKFLSASTLPMVIDADGINILASEKSLLSRVPAFSILTPHQGEFDRLAGKSENGYQRLQKQVELSKTYNIIVVLKGAHTSVSLPSGEVYFNSSGNPGMATAGSGDVLTGIILSFLGQKYEPEHAALLGVYIHGLAGDIAASDTSQESLIASDIINCLGRAFTKIRCNYYE